jgi:SAM-dependent MidA family methyltransferase
MSSADQFPAPSSAALEVSAALTAHVRAAVAQAGGWLDFARYMELVLYAPALGYYSAGSAKLGAAGDFVTAPELSGVLGRAFAATLECELANQPAPTILELGAGSGALAAQIIDELLRLGRADVRYRILEPSADFRARQRQALARFGARIEWLERLPAEPFAGAIVANEVVDALPVRRFVIRGGRALPLGVVEHGDRLELREGSSDDALAAAVGAIERELGAALPDGYRSEICVSLRPWLAALAGSLGQGCVLLSDYGLVRREYYHPQRSAGTFVCHYRHRAHDDPFFLPGLQDLSAWVDFSACAQAAAEAGFAVAGFTTQAQFLLAALTRSPPPPANDARSLREASALRTLLLPGEMGERFKLMLLRKGSAVEGPLPGRDFRDWL